MITLNFQAMRNLLIFMLLFDVIIIYTPEYDNNRNWNLAEPFYIILWILPCQTMLFLIIKDRTSKDSLGTDGILFFY